MEVYVYESPAGLIADFRPYLDGKDNGFEDPLPLKPTDARWEKINSLYHPDTGNPLAGELRLVGKAELEWKELMRFPLSWESEFQQV